MPMIDRATKVIYEWVPEQGEDGRLHEVRKSVTYARATHEEICVEDGCDVLIRWHHIYRAGERGAGRPLNSERRICCDCLCARWTEASLGKYRARLSN